MVEDCPSSQEWRMSSLVRMSTATYKEEHASQSEYVGAVSSVRSEVRQVVIHRYSLGFLPPMGAGRKRVFRRSATSPGVRCGGGASGPGGAEVATNGGSTQGEVVTGFSGL